MKWIDPDVPALAQAADVLSGEREREKTGPRRPGRDCLLRISERRDRLWERNRTLTPRFPGVMDDPQILGSLVCLQPSVLDREYTLDRVVLELASPAACLYVLLRIFGAHPFFFVLPDSGTHEAVVRGEFFACGASGLVRKRCARL